MSEEVTVQPLLEDRSPYAAAAAAARTIAQLSTELKDEETVWAAFANWRGANLAEYIRSVRNTQHSLFYYQLQHLYEFGKECVPAQFREDFCFLAGRNFGEATLAETLYPMLQVALAEPGQFQATVVKMIEVYLYRFTGNKYQLTAQFQPDKVVLVLQERYSENITRYLRQYGLESTLSFRNSFNFIAGAVNFFGSQIIKSYRTKPFSYETAGLRGFIHLPAAETNVFDYEQLLQTLITFIEQVQSRQRSDFEENRLESDLVIASPAMRETWNKVRRASRSDEVVLLLGESGTGKTFIAQKIHSLSRRKDGPFIQVGLTSDLGSDNIIQSNLFGHERGAFTGATEQKQGLFSLAQGGTILLDEIGDASPELQAKLLRVIDTSTFKRLGGVNDIHVDVRIIAATHRPLEKMAAEGKFRRDLYFRLNVIPIEVPPLREQPDSIPALTEFLLARLARAARRLPAKLSPELVSLLQHYPWPGNIRELQNALRHAVAMCESDKLKMADFPESVCGYFQRHGELAAAVASPGGHGGNGEIIDRHALRLAIRALDPKALKAAARKQDLPCTIQYAKKVYLQTLIEECHGDLALIGQYWDHHSEKTLRSMVHALGLTDCLREARQKAKKFES